MKTINRLKFLKVVFLLSTSLLLSCSSNQTPEIPQSEVPASVETLDVTDITYVSAVCKGEITDAGSGTIARYGIELDDGNGNIKKYPFTISSGKQFSVNLTGLTPSHKYNYRAFVDDGSVQYGQWKSFATLAFEGPSPVVTINAHSITRSSATVSIELTSHIKEWGFYYNETDITEDDLGESETSKFNTIKLENLKHSTVYAILPFVIDSWDNKVFLEKQSLTTVSTYHNPVINSDAPDPTVIRAQDGYFYLYHTGVGIHRSENLADWTYLGNAFSTEGRPDWELGGGIWAPDINYINGQYVMYYSLSVWGGEWTCGIGIATSDKPEGPFTDRGKLFRSNEIGVQNSIDPFYIEDNGKKYLFWGSFRSIYGIELTDDGLALEEGAVNQHVAGIWYEGVYIHKRGNYYYMFASIGSCCEGFNSTYTTVVGRSTNLFGPYVNKSGGRMLDNRHEIIIRGNDHFKGTGHNSEIITDDNGNDWIFYHAYKVGDSSSHRVAMMDKVTWVNDWPVVQNGVPSSESDIPVFK